MSGHQMGLLTLRDADGAEYDVAVVFGDVLYRKGSTEERPITDLQSLKASVVAVRIVEAHPFGTLDVGATAAGPLDAPSGEGEPVSHPVRPHETCEPVGSIAEGLLGWGVRSRLSADGSLAATETGRVS